MFNELAYLLKTRKTAVFVVLLLARALFKDYLPLSLIGILWPAHCHCCHVVTIFYCLSVFIFALRIYLSLFYLADFLGFCFDFFQKKKVTTNLNSRLPLLVLFFPLHTLRSNHHHHKVRRSFEYFLFIIKLLCSQQNENSFYTSFKVLTTSGVQFLVFNFLILNIFVFCKKLVNIFFYFLLSFLFSFNFLLLAITFWIISIFIHYNEAYNSIL